MRVFVAGASGVIGRALVPLLVKGGHEVIGMTKDRAKSGLVGSLGARAVVLDVFDRRGLFAVMQQERPEAVIHQLTSLSRADYAANNRIRDEGTRNLVDAAQAEGVKRPEPTGSPISGWASAEV